MRATIDAKEFSNALSKVSRVTSKSAISSLEGVLLQFDGERCILTATDLNVWLSITIPAQGDAFSCVLGQIKQAVRSCRCLDGKLTLEQVKGYRETGPDQLCLSNGSRSGVFSAMPAEDFPDIPALGEQVLFHTSAGALLERIGRVSCAAAKVYEDGGEVRCCVQFSGPYIYAVDGYRLAWDMDETISVPFPLLTRAAFLSNLKYLEGQQLTVYRGTRWLQFVGETARLYCRLAECEHLNLNSVVPTRFQEEFYIDRVEFLRELDYLKSFLPPRLTDGVRFDGGTLSLMKQPGCRTEVSVDLEQGQSCTIPIGLNFSYIMDALNQFEGVSSVKVKVSGSNGPIVLEAEGRRDFALVMPVRLQEQQTAA